jgi:hypothetical protein
MSVCDPLRRFAANAPLGRFTQTQSKKYARYAACCLGMTSESIDHDAGAILREMTAKWLTLAHEALRQSKRE